MAESFIAANTGKFNRTYRLEVETSIPDVFVTLTPPLTMEFDVVRSQLASANTGSFTIYNLGELKRKQLFKDQYDSADATRRVRVFAGYDNGSKKPSGKIEAQIFSGNLRSCYSERQRTEFLTVLDCFDGTVNTQNAVISQPIGKGTTRRQLYNILLKMFPYLDGVYVGEVANKEAKRDGVAVGNVAEILREMTNGRFHIDSNQAFILGQDECLLTAEAFITSETGLIGSPRRSEAKIEFDMIFEPRLQVNQKVTVDSTTNKLYNGTYILTGVTHRGVISDAVGGDCMTTATLIRTSIIRPVAPTL